MRSWAHKRGRAADDSLDGWSAQKGIKRKDFSNGGIIPRKIQVVKHDTRRRKYSTELA